MPGGRVTRVARGSLAARIGLQPGDELVAIDDAPLRDVIDVQYYAAKDQLSLHVRRGEQEQTLAARRRYGEPLGIEFDRPTFDTDIRRCNNHCEFCFVAQMPPGLRRSLYVKDDDYRHSFLFGNYVTLTNLDEADWQRIAEQHLSPLHVSVHATEPELRRQLLHNAAAPEVMGQLRRLAALGIEAHAQLVLLPGLNDGPHLERSLDDLATLYPALRSVSAVPVGLTRFHRGGCRVHTLAEMRATFEQVKRRQEQFLARWGVHFAYLSDEWYLRLGEHVPPTEAYDGLDLTENGVGLVRQFLGSRFQVSGFRATLNLKSETLRLETTLVTGQLFAPTLCQATAHLPGVEVVPIANHFFGETVTVAGLLTTQDVIEQLGGRPLGQRIVLPAAMFGGPEGQSLDEMTVDQVAAALGREVRTAQ
ncbi:MAG: DUF512 domain-containing protein [Anaerolineae bacterium]|nr:DUF512 domain-containing protein [Anaerolineae bacterium]